MRIFISYRREDSAGYTGRVYDHLANHFGANNVFMDIDTIQPGDDFSQVVENAVGSCNVFLTIIGKDWLHVSDARGNRRLDNRADWVRMEISTALKRGIQIIPVLVHGVSMPGIDDLPENIKGLALKHAIEISDSRFQYDAGRLTDALQKIVGKHQSVTHSTISGKSQKKRSGFSIVVGIVFTIAAVGLCITGVVGGYAVLTLVPPLDDPASAYLQIAGLFFGVIISGTIAAISLRKPK